jgi:tetratricopeptide (TPR) repeat protein
VSAADDGAWFARGQAHRRAGRAVDALLCYREALAADRYAIQARFHLGEALRDLGRDGDAFDAWHTVLTVQPGHLPTLLAFGAAARRIGKTAESAEAYRRAMAFEPQSRQARYGLALTRLAAGEGDACAEIQRSIAAGIAFADLQDLPRLLLTAADSSQKQALLGELAAQANDGAPDWLTAMLAQDAAARGEIDRALAIIDQALGDCVGEWKRKTAS